MVALDDSNDLGGIYIPSRACAGSDGVISSQTRLLLWERDSSQVVLLYLWQLHSTHEGYFVPLLFAHHKC